MQLPTADQVKAAGRHVATAIAAVIGTLAMLKIISGGDAQHLQASLDQMSHGAAEFVAGVTSLTVALSGLYAAFSASPLAQLFNGSKAVAADPVKMEAFRTSSVADKAQLASLTEKLPEVAEINVKPTPEGIALAELVPSPNVKPIAVA